MDIIRKIHSRDWKAEFSQDTQSKAMSALENGKILLFPELPFHLIAEEEKFLSPAYANPKFKNISFNNQSNLIRGFNGNNIDNVTLRLMMNRYANCTKALLSNLFPSYTPKIQWGRTSFRPVEIFGRIPKSYRKDDTRLHVDAFPTSPTQGKRIIRVFTNINPDGKDRLWKVGEPFDAVADRFLPQVKLPWFGRSALFNALRITKSYCTPYDYIMLQIHNTMKGSVHYQQTVSQEEIRFWPGNTWIVQTDDVSHAALQGQYVLEQTFYLPVQAMENAELSPLRTLEKKLDKVLVSPNFE